MGLRKRHKHVPKKAGDLFSEDLFRVRRRMTQVWLQMYGSRNKL